MIHTYGWLIDFGVVYHFYKLDMTGYQSFILMMYRFIAKLAVNRFLIKYSKISLDRALHINFKIF